MKRIIKWLLSELEEAVCGLLFLLVLLLPYIIMGFFTGMLLGLLLYY